MNKPLPDPVPASTDEAQVRWAAEYAAQIGPDTPVHNRSGIPIRPLYTPLDVDPARFDAHLRGLLAEANVAGVRVENVEDPLMQKIRYLDKLVDELARGKAMEKVLRG